MRKLFILLLVTFACLNANSQCNCQILNNGGHDIKQCAISPMASDNSLQIGIGAGKMATTTYLSLTIRFRYSALKLKRNLHITLANGKMIELQLLNSGLAYIGNSEVCQATLIVNNSNKTLLKQSTVKTITFSLEDGLKHVLSVKMNGDVISTQLNCL